MRCALVAIAALCVGCAGRTTQEPPKPKPESVAAEPSPVSPQSVFFESFIGNVPVTQSAEVPAGAIEIAIVGYSGKDYAELGRRGAAPAESGRLRASLERLANAEDPVEPRHSSCTFMIDCDEPAVLNVVEQVKAQHGEKPDVSRLVAFVDEYVVNKSLEHAEDLPSQTAVSRAGDCTEHALLFVALARRFGYPARDVSGFVVIAPVGKAPSGAFGHAWAEVHDGRRWRRVDPALGVGPFAAERDPPTSVVSLPVDESGKASEFEISYVPLRVRGEEGPGYERAEASGLTGLHVDALWVPAQRGSGR